MDLFEEYKMLLIGAGGIALSYVPNPIDLMRWVVLFSTFGYTVYKWYLLWKKNKDDEPK